MWLYFSRPTFRPVTVAANANPVLQIAPKRLSVLQRSPRILTDVLSSLPRSNADACQLVCRDFRHTIDERARDLPLYEMIVRLTDQNPLVYYLATVHGRGSVDGYFVRGLRTLDRPYFRNAALAIGTFSTSILSLLAVEMLEFFLQGLSLDEGNLRISLLVCSIEANEASDLFRLSRACDIPVLHISYVYSGKRSATDFIAAVFEEARSTRLSKLFVKINDVDALSCFAVDEHGRKLISEILSHGQMPAAEHLQIILPRLRSYPLISRLIEAIGREAPPRTRMDVVLKFPFNVSLAELWADHTDYFDEARKEWVVPQANGLITMRTRSSGSDTATYAFRRSPLREVLA